MTNLIEYIGQDYTYNIIDLDELHIARPEIMKIWSNLGFTQGLSVDGVIICSNAFDAMLRYLLNYKENTKVDGSDVEVLWNLRSNEYDDMFSTVAFPIIRRLYSRGVVLEPKQLYKLFNKLSSSIFRNVERKLESGIKIDVEAEATALLCDVIVKRVKKNKKKRKQRRKYERHKN